MARLYANENLPLPVVERLRELGHDVLTTAEARKSNNRIPDDEVLDFAAAHGRAVVTLNRRHFIRLHESGRAHHGIIVCTFNPDFAEQAAQIDEELRRAADLRHTLVRLHGCSRTYAMI